MSKVPVVLSGRASRGCNYLMCSRCGRWCSTSRIWCRTRGWSRRSRWPSRAGLIELADQHLTVPGGAGSRGRVEGVCAGRGHGRRVRTRSPTWTCCGTAGWGGCSTGVRAPSTLGTFLRAFTFGHVRQLDAVAARFVAGLAGQAPIVAADAAITYWISMTPSGPPTAMPSRAPGTATRRSRASTRCWRPCPPAGRAPVIVATRLRKGAANSARGAARLVADALATTGRCGVGGTVVLRADSAFYGRDVIAAARRGGARFSITARKDQAVDRGDRLRSPTTRGRRSNTPTPSSTNSCGSGSPTPKSPRSLSPPSPPAARRNAVTARLIVRRVRDQNPAHVVAQRAGRTVPGLASPRRVHRLAAAHAGSRGRPPPPRHHRTGHRRPQERARWRTCRPGSSRRTPPGWPSRRSRST